MYSLALIYKIVEVTLVKDNTSHNKKSYHKMRTILFGPYGNKSSKNLATTKLNTLQIKIQYKN